MRKLSYIMLLTGLFSVTECVGQFTPAIETIRFSELPQITPAQAGRIKFVEDNYFGLTVQNHSGDFIGRPFSKRGPWMPLFGGFRLTVSGILSGLFVETGHNDDSHPLLDQDEYDWNFNIKPNSAFLKGVKFFPDNCYNCNFSSNQKEGSFIQCEVTPDLLLRNKISTYRSLTVYRAVCLYGPYVSDWGHTNWADNHDEQREIHPVEAFWWQNVQKKNDDLTLILFQDASRLRFHEYDDFDFDVDNDFIPDSLPGWKPWVENPMKQTFKIPFEYDLDSARHLVVDIWEIQKNNVSTVLYPDIRDSVYAATHKLQISFQSNEGVSVAQPMPTVVQVNKQGDAMANLGVRFTDICRSKDGKKISGYIKISTALGRAGANDPYGHQVLHIKKRFVTDLIDSREGH